MQSINMFGVLTLGVAVLGWLPVHSQPVSCKEDAQCSEGYYCEAEAYICRECLSCEDLKREPLLAVNTCIKSVADCGSCNKGLVKNHRGDVNAACVPPDTSQQESTPYYVWLLIGVGVLLFVVLVIGIIAYLLRNPEIFKTPGSHPSSTVTARITATAPEAPPPYTEEVPFRSPTYSEPETTVYNEDDRLFIERPSPRPAPSRPHNARESADNQAAGVYHKPIYEQEPQQPSPESPLAEYDSMAPVYDDDTVPSPWVPGGPPTNGDINVNTANENSAGGNTEGAGAALPALLAAARDTTLVEPSPKKRRVGQDSNNNRNRESNSCSGDSSQDSFPRSPSPSQGGPPYSFITQITNVVQINTSK